MDDIFLRKQVIEDKLDEERRRSEMIKESLAKAQLLTDNMVSILSQFDERLHTLEDTILPVHRKTKDLQRLQDNIEKTTAALDKVISYHHVAQEVEGIMRQGPSRQVERYLSSMNRLEKSITFFSENNPDSPELNTVNLLFSNGKESLEKEFQAQLSRQNKITAAEKILEIVPQDLTGEDIYQYMSEKTILDLSKIAQWLYGPGNSKNFESIYANIRSKHLVQTLESLRDETKSKSNMATKKVGNLGGTPRKPGARRTRGFDRKKDTGIGKSSFAPISEEDILEVEIEPFVAMLNGCVRIFLVEKLILQKVMPSACWKNVFDSTIRAAMDLLIKSGNNFVDFSKQCIARHDHPSIVTIFPVIKQLKGVSPLYKEIFEQASFNSWRDLQELVSDLELNGVRVLEDFTDCVKSDPEKESNMPKDGIVHELTSNAMLFLQQLAQNVEEAGGMLAAQHHPVASEKKSLSTYIYHVLAALKLNLENKSRVYLDSSLAAVFLLNNFDFILTSLNRHELLFLVQLSAPNIEKIYDGFINEQKLAYLRCWDKVAGHLTDDGRASLASVQAGTKLKDKEKQLVKDKFKSFNNDFDDLVKTHQRWAMPSASVKKEIRNSVKQKIVGPYTSFNDKYRMVQFTKNIDKYLKHTAQSVEDDINRIFDQCST